MFQSPDSLTALPASAADSAAAGYAFPNGAGVGEDGEAEGASGGYQTVIPTIFNTPADTLSIGSEQTKEDAPLSLQDGLLADRMGFFSGSEWANDSVKTRIVGESGDLVPYKLANDTFVTATLLVCLLMACFVIGRSLRPLALQIKGFFRLKDRDEDFSLQSEKNVNGRVLVVLLESFVVSLLFFSYAQFRLTDTFTTTSPYVMLLADIGVCLLYFVVKGCFYRVVNWTFFLREQRRQWRGGYDLISFGKAVTLLPLAMVVLYFDLPIRVCIAGCLIVVGVYELLIFYRTRQIFFSLPFGTIQAFLYFCTLELLPLFFLWEMLVKTSLFLAA